ncbi:MAG: hypothetical protein ACI4U5_03275 [Bacilli bacterium]
MAKKSKKSVALLSSFLSLIFGVLTFVCMFLDGVTKKVGEETEAYKGMELAFGKTLSAGSIIGISADSTIQFSFLLVLAFLLPLVLAVVYILLSKKAPTILSIVCAAGFVVSAVLLFMTPSLSSLKTTVSVSVLGSTSSQVNTFKELEYSLGVGAIVGAVSSILGALSSLIYVIKKLF